MNQPFSMGFLGADSKTAKTDSIWRFMASKFTIRLYTTQKVHGEK